MKRHVLTIKLRNDKDAIQAYKRYHANVWPEVKEALREVGVQHMQTYLQGNRLCTIIEARDGFDPRVDLKRYATSPRVEEWDRIMSALQASVDGPGGTPAWVPMEIVYDDTWPSE
jgi:L-rhamnose mutarotase